MSVGFCGHCGKSYPFDVTHICSGPDASSMPRAVRSSPLRPIAPPPLSPEVAAFIRTDFDRYMRDEPSIVGDVINGDSGATVDRYPIPGGKSNPHFEAIKAQIGKAIADERDRCAKIAEEAADSIRRNIGLAHPGSQQAMEIAAQLHDSVAAKIRSGE